MGNNKMANSLMFMVYSDETGSNITLSPRFADGNSEPEHTKDIVVEVRPGSGIANGVMTAAAMCYNCRSWSGGSVNVNNTKASFIFAHGPDEDFKSDSTNAALKRHAGYGSFTMDLTTAEGSKTVPIVSYGDTTGTTQNSLKSDRDLGPPFHAALMITAFVIIMPLGVLILRVIESPKWHGINQAVSAFIALVGVCFAVYISTLYNRVRPA